MTDAPSPKRRPFSKDAKIAALTCIVFDIPHEHQKLMHADQVAMLIEWHHNVYHAYEGGEHFSNATPMLVAHHKDRTAKIDIPQIAKGKRLRNRETVRRFKEVAKVDPAAAAELYPSAARLDRRKHKIPNRPFPKLHRPLRSRNNLPRRKDARIDRR